MFQVRSGRWIHVAICAMSLVFLLAGGCKKGSSDSGCETTEECGGKEICVSGRCIAPSSDCTSNVDCGALRYCDNGSCLGKSCQSNSQCLGGVCNKGVCSEGTSVPCQSNIDCSVKQTCNTSTGVCDDIVQQVCGCTPEESCTLTDPSCLNRPCQTALDCSDDDLCTEDRCIDGLCKNVKSDPSCCQSDGDCKVSNLCAPEKCSDGKCVVIGTPDPNCCDSPADCNDSNPCTTDRCISNICVNTNDSTDSSCECTGTADCDDHNPCTADSCVAGSCQYTFLGGEGCCKVDQECNDNNSSTEDRCLHNLCQNKVLTECTSAVQCDDKDACTTDSCLSGFCSNEPTNDSLCCNKNENCNDLNDSTLDRCVANRCVHSLTEEPETCSVSGDCKLTGACTTAACVSGFCSYTVSQDGTCCNADSDCDDKNSCTENKCVDFSCKTTVKSDAGCCTADSDCKDLNECTEEACIDNQCKVESVSEKAYWKSTFEAGNDGFTFTGGAADVKWQVTDHRAGEGKFSLYYGDISTHTYDSGLSSNTGSATSPSITLPDSDDIKLKFKAWIKTESSFVSFDSVSMSIKVDGEETEVWDKGDVNGDTKGKFEDTEVDLSKWKGKTIQLVFTFDTGDSLSNDYEGVYIDDLRIVAPCITKSCTVDKDCDDSNICTQDVCDPASKLCKNNPIADCCLNESDCNDNDDCTTDSCSDSGKCEYKNLCCFSNGECDDSNDCTIDTCQNKSCVYQLKQDPNCCIPSIFASNFDDGKLDKFVVEDDGTNVKWQVTTLRSMSGTYSLYFGDPALHNYDNDDIAKGSITGPEIIIPAGGEARLKFNIWMKTESSSSHDKLWISVVIGTEETQIWAKADLGSTNFSKWKAQEVDLTQFAGKTIKLKFSFDSNDTTLNTYEGVYIDDVEVIMPCVVQTCSVDKDCNDFNGCTADTCDNGNCKYNPIPNCCQKNEDCDDKNACTKDSCVENQCQKEIICCKKDEECDDSDDCTIDSCDSDECVYKLDVPKPGCCKSNLFSEFFEAVTLDAFELDGNSEQVKWQLSKLRAFAGTQSLYFGDIDKLNYVGDGNKVTGTATSGEIQLQPGVDMLIKFRLYIDVEPAENFDQFSVQVVGKTTKTVWDKTQLTTDQYKKWIEVEIPVADFEGQKVKIRFKFDSKDGAGNTQEGVYVDNLQVGSKCSD